MIASSNKIMRNVETMVKKFDYKMNLMKPMTKSTPRFQVVIGLFVPTSKFKPKCYSKIFQFSLSKTIKRINQLPNMKKKKSKVPIRKEFLQRFEVEGGPTPLWPFNILELKTFILANLRTILLQVYKEQCKKYDTLSMFHQHCSHHRTMVVMFWNIFLFLDHLFEIFLQNLCNKLLWS